MSDPILLSDAIQAKCKQIANTGTFEQAHAAMVEAFKSSRALCTWFDCPDATDSEKCQRQAAQAVFFYRQIKSVPASEKDGKPVRTDPWPAGKINTEFGMHITGKSKEEVEKLYAEFSEKQKRG